MSPPEKDVATLQKGLLAMGELSRMVPKIGIKAWALTPWHNVARDLAHEAWLFPASEIR